MNRFIIISCVAIIGALMVNSAFAQRVHIVGDSLGWDVPPNGAEAYTNWASGKTFMVGDTLVFNFMTNNHDVLQVPRASFDGCTSDNGIGNVILTGPANVTLTSPGDHYYICTIGRHCLAGQKLAISVVSGTPTGGANPPPSATPSMPPPPATTPSPAASNEPPCAPTPLPSSSNDPNTGGPAATAPMPPPPPPRSSSSKAIFASVVVTLASIVVAVGVLF